jgi:hypothetical protein
VSCCLADIASITVEDRCDPDPEIVLESIVSNQDEDGVGDGSTNPDVVADIGTDDRDFQLRAERAGGATRVYEITYSATDDSGNTTEVTVEVTVPANLGMSGKAGFSID